MSTLRRLLRGWIAVLVSGVAAAVAAPAEHELGRGLIYVRVRALPADLPRAPAGRVPPCVVDVRYVPAGAEAADTFLAWLKFRATPRTPVFVLANGDTSAELRHALAGHPRGSGIVVVGLAARDFKPDVEARGTPEAERRAYDAFEQGGALAKLLADNPDKVRNDEASLSRDRLAEASADAADDVLQGKREPPPIDVTLQRAVHLHRALVALKKI